MGVRPIVRLTLLLVLLVLAGGYATAFLSRDACVDDAWSELARSASVAMRSAAPTARC